MPGDVLENNFIKKEKVRNSRLGSCMHQMMKITKNGKITDAFLSIASIIFFLTEKIV